MGHQSGRIENLIESAIEKTSYPGTLLDFPSWIDWNYLFSWKGPTSSHFGNGRDFLLFLCGTPIIWLFERRKSPVRCQNSDQITNLIEFPITMIRKKTCIPFSFDFPGWTYLAGLRRVNSKFGTRIMVGRKI